MNPAPSFRSIRYVRVFLLATAIGIANPAIAAQLSDPPIQTAQVKSSDTPAGEQVAQAKPPSQQSPPQQTTQAPLAGAMATGASPPTSTFSVQAFQTDLFTGASTTEIPIIVPPGTAGVAPKIVLRYNSGVVDEMEPRDQAQWTGLGWTLDTGGFIIRDTKGTTDTADDTFKLVFGGDTHDLVSAGGGSYRAKEETFWLINYVSSGDYWTVKTKDGTTHRFGFNTDSKATGLTFGPNVEVPVTFRYYVDEVATTSGVSVRYSYFKQSSSYNAKPYDQAVYPDTITYSYHSGSLVGPERKVSFIRGSRNDWTDTSPSTHTSYHELSRLDAIEVQVGGGLARKYIFGFDYSIDRDSNHTWGGGATGDLTLRSVTMHGSDGVSALPSLGFTYNGPVLASASNGIGGTVSFNYQKLPVTAFYRSRFWVSGEGCVAPDWSLLPGNCDDGPGGGGDPRTTLVGYLGATSALGTIPFYRSRFWVSGEGCVAPDWSLLPGNCDDGPGGGGDPRTTLVGYMYAGKVDRYQVITRTLSDGLGWSTTTNFTYTDIGFSSDGKEFRGHAKVRATDPLGHYTDTYFKQDDVFKGHPYQIETRSSTGALFSQVVNTWSSTSPYPGVNFVFLSRADNYECDGQPTCLQTAQTFTYDGNGNPTQVYHLGEVPVSGDERDERTDWMVDTTNWIHRPSRAALYDASSTLLRERWLSYDSLGRFTREESRLAGPQGSAGNPVVTHAYDAYGNRTSITDPRGCTTTTTFDSSQTYPATVTTCLNHTTNFQYDARFGVMTSQTDPNNQTTTSTYDVFGRLTTVTGPLDTASTYGTMSRFYLDWGTPSVQRIQTFRTEQHGSGNVIWSEEYFDGLGRIDQTRQEGPGGQMIQTETTFDARGQVATQSAPHFSAETAVLTQFSYDVLGRQTQVTHPDGTFATTSYVHDVITLTDERGNVKRKYLDAYDRLERVDEVNGAETYVTTYQYDAAGSLSRVTNHLGHVTQMTYDLLGRKVTMQDPNMGVWNYSYDPGGNLITQTDAKNQTLTFDYDLQSRLVRKTYPDARQIIWTYDDPAVTHSKGRLTRVVDLSATTDFTYDQLGRVTQTQRTLGVATYTMAQTYDALGRVVSETFPDADSVSYNYNEAGWLSGVPGYVDSITYNARGQKSQLQYANGVTTSWTYNTQNFRVTNRSTSGSAGNFQNLSYAYDNVGNITAITDTIFSGGRSFTYDALNRLTSASGPFGTNQSQVTQSYSYDAIGNILEKGGVLYSYTDPLHPSAVTFTSDGRSYTYDANGNMLTGGDRTFTWDADNRLDTVTGPGGTGIMAYDYTGIRVKKDGSGGTTYFPFSGYQIDNGVITKYIRIGIENIAAKKSTGETFFYHNDHLGGVNVITNDLGIMAQIIEYDPWGKVSREEGIGDSLRRFTGKILDPESGLYYYGGRYYDPELGRFISADPFIGQPDDPQNHNRYSYVINNPVNGIDPDGYFHQVKKQKKKKGGFFRSFFGFFIGAIVGVVTGGAGFAIAQAAGFAATTATAIGTIAGGMAAGAVSAAIGGGDPGLGALIGGAFAFVAASPALADLGSGIGGLGGGGFGGAGPLGFCCVSFLAAAGADFPSSVSSNVFIRAGAALGALGGWLVGEVEAADFRHRQIPAGGGGGGGPVGSRGGGAGLNVGGRQIPQQALDVLQETRVRGGDPLPGYRGGQPFENRGPTKLPPGTYKEYDIYPRIPGQNRGTERIVIEQSTGKAYYTSDHYKTFLPFQE